jgi:hypothetical protein
MKFCVLAAVFTLSVALSACEGNWGKAFVQGQWFEKACGAGGGHYDASSNGSCADFSPKEVF